MTHPHSVAAGVTAATASAPPSHHTRKSALVRTHRLTGFAVLSGALAASCLVGAGPAAAGPTAAAGSLAGNVVLRPSGDVSAFTVVPSGRASAALDDRITKAGTPTDADYLTPGSAGSSTTVTLSRAALGKGKAKASRAWFSASTGGGSGLRVEVLWGGAVRATTVVPAGSRLAWRSVRFTPAGQRAVDDLQIRFTAVGGSEVQVRAAYAAVARTRGKTLLLRPDGDVAALPVHPGGTAAGALDDEVSAPTKPSTVDYLRSTRAGQSTTVELGDAALGLAKPGKSRAWFYASTGKATRLRVEVLWGGRVHAAATVAARKGNAWRSVSFTPPSAGAVDDLRLRFTTSGGRTSTVRAAYADVSTTTDAAAEVNAYLRGLQPVAPGPEVPAHTVGGEQTLPPSPVLPDPSAPSGHSIYDCRQTPYSLSTSPDKIVAYNPDANKLWLGGMLQGQGYADGLGSLRELPIRKRAPMKIYIDLLGPGVTTTVTDPDGASMQQGIADLVQRAKTAGVAFPARADFQQVEQNSSSEALLKLGVSAKYMGASASAKLESQRNAQESSVLASFFQRMFTVSIVAPATPAGYFSSSFTAQDLKDQADQGRIAPDNPPVVVGSISYGRVLMYSVTSTGSKSEISGAINAAWDGGAASGSVEVTARQQEILNKAEYHVVALGGEESQVQSLIKSRRLGDYFTGSADPVTAVPISYQVNNIGNDSAAKFTETTSYNLTECHPIANHQRIIGATVRLARPQFYLTGPRNPADVYGSLTVNGSEQWSRGRDGTQKIHLHNETAPEPWQSPGDQAPWEVKLGMDEPLDLHGSVNCKLGWLEIGDDPSNQYHWQWRPNSQQYGDVVLSGGSRHCGIDLRTTVTKVSDTVVWEP